MKVDWTGPTSSVERERIEGKCPACTQQALHRYPVLSEGGWFMVFKCSTCLHSVERTPWNRLGWVSRLEDQFL